MEAVVSSWGNSLAVRIPKKIAADANLQSGDVVDISTQDGTVVFHKKLERISFSELIAGHDKPFQVSETDWGEPVGDEEW